MPTGASPGLSEDLTSILNPGLNNLHRYQCLLSTYCVPGTLQ